MLISFFAGAAAGAASILLHLQLPPMGLLLAFIGSATTIWACTQKFSSRSAGFIAAVAWIVVVWRGAITGSGNELLVQGDLLGEVLVLLGSVIVLTTSYFSRVK
mgnify:FL=1